MTASSAPSTKDLTHPLDPLTPEEIGRAAALVRELTEFGPRSRFVGISPSEPHRRAIGEFRRAAEVVFYDRTSRTTVECNVDLGRNELSSVVARTDVEPPITPDEVHVLEQATRSHPPFQDALRRRGIDQALVEIDPAPMGFYEAEGEPPAGRFARILVWVRPDPGGNHYARPVEGLFGVVELNSGEVVQFEDRRILPVPAETGEYRADRTPLRAAPAPIEITQPRGTSFAVEGHEVRWQNWSLRIGFNTREGLVLHKVAYEDNGRRRAILDRASYAEMIVPYADPERFFQSPLDIGEFYIGMLANSLTLGCDCLGEIRYFDAAVVNSEGEAVIIPNAICLHEEDDGLLWKHTDFRTGECEVRRGRRLVISCIVTVGNYEYGFFWYLHQDGMIASEVKATGIVATQAVAERPSPFGRLVAPGLSATNHQHIFCVRLDFDLDGGPNSVAELNSESLPIGPDNPHGNAWIAVSRTLETELEARRDVSPTTARSWVVTNGSQRNAVGEPVGYRLVPGDNTVTFAAPGSSVRRRAAFMDHHLWVTRYAPDERYPAGDYPYQHPGGDGLPRWNQADRSVHDTDIVVWYTMNHHHVPRPEDWPIMPVARIGFQLKPWGFFDRSPAVDVPPSEPAEHGCHARVHEDDRG